MTGTINILVRADEEDELTQEEKAIVIEAFKQHYEMLRDSPQGDRRKAELLISAATKMGFYTPE